MTRKGYEVTFNRNSCTIRDGNEVLATGTQVNGVYQLDTVSDNASTAAGNAAKVEECELVAATAAASTPQELWHRRLGHLNARSMNLLRKGMAEFLKANGIKHQKTIPDSPQQNGVAERANRTIMEKVRCMLMDAGLGMKFWAEAVNTAVYLKNRSPTKAVLGATPEEKWSKKKIPSDISDDRQSQNINRISTITLDDSESEDSTNEGPDDRLDTTYVPGRESLAEAELTSDSSYDDVAESPLRANFVRLADHDPDEPQTATEALNGPEADGWRKAMKDEYDSFIKNKCWTLTERDPEHKPVKCKWVYKKKYGLNGELLKFKARLVAKGYSQQYGIDYQETFSPVVRYSTIRMLLALSAEYNMSIDHLDVKTAFLNGELEETVYMEQPEGFEVPGSGNMVYKLNKAVYGLKQASKSWYDKITKVLCDKLDFSRLSSEPCVYFKYDKNDSRSMMIIALYVVDLIVFTSPEFQGKEEIKRKLQNEFDITDLGPAQHILGMKLCGKGNNISLDQSNYIEKLLKKYRMEECKAVGTPMETGLKLTKESQSNDTYDYRGLIGSLMSVAVSTRADNSYAVSYLSQFNNCFGESHWKAAKRILRYLKGAINLGLTFYKSGLDITAYADADWASDNHDRRSYTGRDRNYVHTQQERGGGVLIAIKKELKAIERSDWNSSAEDLWISVSLRCPCFSDKLEYATTHNDSDKFLILGDFNMSFIKWISTECGLEASSVTGAGVSVAPQPVGLMICGW
ncbi:unnamed protein product [Plutella xylostella]|uniref:(diamondback moth) hypothetical protein n=1 Tax=Plutella xylostella TaxID=51655 RepID=A0A8S4GA72_PLUXY|nr:unnamed protein product [Plutella xylostella]